MQLRAGNRVIDLESLNSIPSRAVHAHRVQSVLTSIENNACDRVQDVTADTRDT